MLHFTITWNNAYMLFDIFDNENNALKTIELLFVVDVDISKDREMS